MLPTFLALLDRSWVVHCSPCSMEITDMLQFESFKEAAQSALGDDFLIVKKGKCFIATVQQETLKSLVYDSDRETWRLILSVEHANFDTVCSEAKRLGILVDTAEDTVYTSN